MSDDIHPPDERPEDGQIVIVWTDPGRYPSAIGSYCAATESVMGSMPSPNWEDVIGWRDGAMHPEENNA